MDDDMRKAVEETAKRYKQKKMVDEIMERHKDLFKELAKGAPEKRKPTGEKNEHWIYAFHGQCPESGTYVGKWLIFANDDEIDRLWEKVRDATIAGKLTFEAKVSTARTRDKYPSYVICVYTLDYRDKTDVERAHERLLSLGITPLRYKTDYETIHGVPPNEPKERREVERE